MSGLTRKRMITELRRAMADLQDMMSSHDGSKYAKGLSSEGYHGGYWQAMADIDALLSHGTPPTSMTLSRRLWGKVTS